MSELEIVQHRQMEGLSLFFDTVEYRTPHFHPEWELIWITDGLLSVRCGPVTCPGEAGELFLFYPGQVHEFQMLGRSATFLCLQVSPQVFGQAFPELGRIALEEFRIRRCLEDSACEALREQLRRMMGAYLAREPYYELECLGLCGALLHRLLTALPCHSMSAEESSSSDRRNARLERFIRFVDENYMHKLRLSDFAAAEGCTVSYLSRFIREALNQSFQDYVNSVRFHSACRMMAAGEGKMLDICEASGFSDYRYFSKVFKAQTGMTPEGYSRVAVKPEGTPARRSLHSSERFYTREQSLAMLRELRP